MPVSTNPPVIVFGQTLLDHTDDAARFFLLLRSLTIWHGRAATVSRTPPIELPAIVSAFLSLFATNWTPQGVDPKKLADSRAKLEQAMRARLDDDVPGFGARSHRQPQQPREPTRHRDHINGRYYHRSVGGRLTLRGLAHGQRRVPVSSLARQQAPSYVKMGDPQPARSA